MLRIGIHQIGSDGGSTRLVAVIALRQHIGKEKQLHHPEKEYELNNDQGP